MAFPISSACPDTVASYDEKACSDCKDVKKQSWDSDATKCIVCSDAMDGCEECNTKDACNVCEKGKYAADAACAGK